MDELLNTALMGTAKAATSPQRQAPAMWSTELGDLTAERQLLLAVGVEAVREFAGAVSVAPTAMCDPAQTETLRVISPSVELLLLDLLNRPAADAPLLAEACDLLRDRGFVLAPALLPAALQISDKPMRAKLRPILGARGRWLAQFDANWGWAADESIDGAGAGSAITQHALEQQWNDGDASMRLAALKIARHQFSQLARRWLESAWPKEKVESRLDLLEAIADSIDAEDVPFLDSLGKDRSAQVRARASELLCRLPNTATAQQAILWAHDMLVAAAPQKSLISKLRHLAGGGASLAITAAVPAKYLDVWRALGIPETASGEIGNRAAWMIEILRRVNPRYWESRFQASPVDLVEAVRSDDFASDVLFAWTQATALFAARDWANALWTYWLSVDSTPKAGGLHLRRPGAQQMLLAAMSPQDAERAIARTIGVANPGGAGISHLVDLLQKPWSQDFGASYLKCIRAALEQTNRGPEFYEWTATLGSAALGPPAECFAEAQREWSLPEGDDYLDRHVRTMLQGFQEKSQLRARLRDLLSAE
jgi:hypothetical protein